MAEDLHKDNLEEFFKQTFDEQSEQPAADGWDVPSDKVWDKIDEAIPPTPGQSTPIWLKYWWLGAIVLVILSSGIIYFNTKESTDLQPESTKEMVDQQMDVDETTKNPIEYSSSEKMLPNENGTNATDDTGALNTEKDEGLISSSKSQAERKPQAETNSRREFIDEQVVSSTKKSKVTNSAKEQDKTKGPKSTQLPNSSLTSKQKENIASSDANSTSDQTDKNTSKQKEEPTGVTTDQENMVVSPTPKQPTAVTEDEVLSSISILPLLTTKDFSPLPVDSPLPEQLDFPATPFTDLDKSPDSQDPSSVKGFYTGITLAPTNTYRTIQAKGSRVIPNLINRNENARYSFSTGANVGYRFSKHFSIESGFAYSKLSTRFRSARQVQYTMINERPLGNNEFENDYRIDLRTSSGDIGTDIALARSSSTPIQENEFINLEFRGRQNISLGSVPIIARYQIGKGNWQLGLKAGLVNRFVLEGTFQIEQARVFNRPGVRFIDNDRLYAPRKIRNLKSYTADYLFGAGLSYNINNRIWILVEPTITRSMNPLFENQSFKTFPVVKSVDFGIQYLF